ncbi:MAG: abortive infection family protein [Anaerolineaceae bacterium]|nr:abortive infection family protein [Anaerolineaceae bacterium]
MAENHARSFVMHGARDAIASGMTHIERHVEELERAVVDNPALAFDLARTLVECTCRTILKEKGIEYSHKEDLPKLFNKVTDTLPVLPPTSSDASDVGKSLKQTLNGLKTAILGICELRNICGFASHGSDSARPAMEDVQAIMAAKTADTVIGFLYRMHIQDRSSALIDYNSNPAFNDSFDESVGPVSFSDVVFRASEVLFTMEPETYRIYLAEYESEADSGLTSAGGNAS